MFTELIQFIRDQYRTNDFIPLHAPVFSGSEQQYVADTISSTFVSSVGAYVDRFEHDLAIYTGTPKATATVSGTAALHMALLMAGVQKRDLVITQPLTFVATCNAINYLGAEPVFVDVDQKTMGLSPTALNDWLEEYTEICTDGVCRTLKDSRVVRTCVPMHTFGHPADLDGLTTVSKKWNLVLIEDAAEALGSLYKGRHTGTFGSLGITSFNGNKIITTGGGGMILSNEYLGRRAKHLTTTAKIFHSYEYMHDEIGYNYRMPNINAALGCAQMEQLDSFIQAKRDLAERYRELLRNSSLQFFTEPPHCRSNYWLNAVICEDRKQRDALLRESNEQKVMTRPIWELMSRLPMFAQCRKGPLEHAEWLRERVVNIPSSVLPERMT